MVDISVGNPSAISARRDASHDIIKLTGEVTEFRCSLANHGISNNAIINTVDSSVGNIDSINPIVNTNVRGGVKVELVVGTCSVLTLEVHHIAIGAEDFVSEDILA